MKTVMLVLMLILTLANENIYAEDKIVRFDFQADAGEGTLELYRIDINIPQQKGELCFLHTTRSSVPTRIMKLLRDGTNWPKVIDMKNYEHACFTFDLYEPFGWFYSPTVKYSEAEYAFFFVGEINKAKIKGQLYQFRNFLPSGEATSYKTIRTIEIAAKGSTLKQKPVGQVP